MNNKKYRAVIIDDEQAAIDVLRLLLQEHCPEVKVCYSTLDSEEGVQLIREHQPDVVFLDIEMLRLNGFQLLEKVQDIYFHLIFTTAYDQYAIKAFKYCAMDYLLKPIMADELKTAVAKLHDDNPRYYEQTKVLEQNLQAVKEARAPERIILPQAKGYLFQKVEEILYCEAFNTYTKFFIEGKLPLLISKPLGDVEEILHSAGFFRTHRQFLVNIKKMVEFVRTD